MQYMIMYSEYFELHFLQAYEHTTADLISLLCKV